MTLSVKDLLTFGGLQDAKVVAGERGLDDGVESISVLEVAEPEVAAWMLSGQLYITSFYAIRSDAQSQAKVIEALHSAGSCGLVICHIDRWVRNLAPEIIALCDRLDFPLIIANPETSYIEILSPVIEQLASIADSDSRLFIPTLNRLIDLVANEERLEVIFKKIAALFQHELVFFNINNQGLYTNALTSGKTIRRIKTYINAHYAEVNAESSNQDCIDRQIDERSWLIYPIRAAGTVHGYILVNNDVTEELASRKLISNVAKICSLIYVRRNDSREMSEVSQQDFLRDLTFWNFPNDEEAIAAGARIDIDITGQCHVVILHADFSGRRDVQLALRELLPHIQRLSRQANPQNAAVLYGDGCFTLLRTINDDSADFQLINKIQRLSQQYLPTPFVIGVSDLVSHCREIPGAYRESLHAVQAGRHFIGNNQVIRFASLGFLPMIGEFRSDPRMREIAVSLLRPLQEYDKEHNTRLCQTLNSILQSDMDLAITAEKLFVHKNTVLYRKNKIIDILGINPFKMPYLLNFILASSITKA